MGLPPPGILRGATKIYGFKQECDIVYYKVPHRSRPFETMYSGVFLDAYALTGIQNATCDSTKTLLIRYDVCLPRSCNKDDILTILKNGE